MSLSNGIRATNVGSSSDPYVSMLLAMLADLNISKEKSQKSGERMVQPSETPKPQQAQSIKPVLKSLEENKMETSNPTQKIETHVSQLERRCNEQEIVIQTSNIRLKEISEKHENMEKANATRFDELEMIIAQLLKDNLVEGEHEYDTPSASTTPTTIAKENTAASPNTPETSIHGSGDGILPLPSTPPLMKLDLAPTNETQSSLVPKIETHSPKNETHSPIQVLSNYQSRIEFAIKKREIPVYEGQNPKDWVYWDEKYFEYNRTTEVEKDLGLVLKSARRKRKKRICASPDSEESMVNELGDIDESLMKDSVVYETDGIRYNVSESSEAARALSDRYHAPVELYRELRQSEMRSKLERSEWDTVHEIFGYFAQSGWAANQALAIYIGKSFFSTAISKFRDFFIEKCKNEVVQDLVHVGSTDEAVKFLFPAFVEFCIEEFPDEIERFKSIVETADLTKPGTWFPFARAMKRKIVYHCGPTNSGKTYNALQRFMEAKNGLYCSPLRLLAMEVFDKINALGIYCSLLTGQEKKQVPFANHVSCTVEMVSTDELYEVAVIDEIQMMADVSRGHAWTKALLGLKADEIHLCGDPSVLDIVRKMCADTGDELIEEHYERFKPLVVEAKTLLGDLKNVKSGDCVVAFSRREIFEVKMAIEKHTNHRCCVIYGALPPETRRQQADLFNDQENEYDVLVASDAVGMGLNLNIRRVVFYSLNKYNGDKIVPVAASQAKQMPCKHKFHGDCLLSWLERHSSWPVSRNQIPADEPKTKTARTETSVNGQLLELSCLGSKVLRYLITHLEDKVSSKGDGIDKIGIKHKNG